ncbi:MAG: hypothetical protein SGCHY_004212 [Lobulomycetales sp.]
MVQYGGNEVSALVFDIGASSSKAGYAGSDAPCHVWSSVGACKDSAIHLGHFSDSLYRSADWSRAPIVNGLVADWDALEANWSYAYDSALRTPAADHPLMLTEAAWSDPAQREKLAELAFEKFNVPALYIAPSPVLAAFSAARSTALVIDSGAEVTSVVPVLDSFVMKKAIRRQALAGDFVTAQAASYLEKEYGRTPLVPQYMVSSKQGVDPDCDPVFVAREGVEASPSFHARALAKCMADFKETVCANLESTFDARVAQSRPKKPYEFPNGWNTSLGKLRYQIPECLFDPKQYAIPPPAAGDDAMVVDADGGPASEFVGVQRLAHDAVQACDTDVRSVLYTNVVLTGGNTLLPGFADRLHYELNMLAPGIRVRLHAAGSTVERKYGAWIGASILASLGTFHQLWVSKAEYEEVGAGVMESR